MTYTFDGNDRVEDENGVLYRDGLDKRSGPIVVALLEENEQLKQAVTRFARMLDDRNRVIIALNAEWAVEELEA